MPRLPLAASALLIACAGAAWAQTDPMAQARVAAYNQVGVMEYCQSSGFAGPADVAAQRATLTGLPPGPVTPEMTAAEAAGRSGTIASPNGTTTAVSAMAAAKQVSAMSAAGGMPAMPTGIPAMPGGMPAMPSMPGMPAMPGAAPTR